MGGPRFVAIATTFVFAMAACTGTTPPSESPPGDTPTPAAVTPSPAAPSSEPTASPVLTEAETETFPYDRFTDPATVDHPFYPLVPGTQFVYEGEVNTADGRVDHQVIFTVTDLTKVVDGVEAVVIHDVDWTGGEIVETEIAFFAQDDDGNVWLMGEYPEEYENGEFVDAPTWLAGLAGAKAGITLRADPRVGAPSHSQGWGPGVGFNDRGRVFEVDSRTCVPARCYDGVLVTDEFNPDEPDSHQLKYYAPGVGVVRVGWAGALEASQETLELVRVVQLDEAALAEIRDAALALEAHALEISPDMYAQTEPLKRRP